MDGLTLGPLLLTLPWTHSMMPSGSSVFESDIPPRLDRLPFGRWHWRIVLALGITWILDGLEVTVVGALGGALELDDTLHLTSTQVGMAGSSYLAGAMLGALFFGHLTDRLGRKRLFLITLALYVVSTLSTAASFNFISFAVFRFATGAAIGGEYTAINSAIDELLPARLRGRMALAINGTYWIGTALGALSTVVLLDPAIVPSAWGWRLAFGLGAFLASGVLLVRRHVPESPRWLLMHRRVEEAERIVRLVELEVSKGNLATLPEVHSRATIHVSDKPGLTRVIAAVRGPYRARAALALVLMVAQAFFYNAIFFSYALLLTKFFDVAPDRVGLYLIPFAVGNFLGPLLLGRLFDTVGRRIMIPFTYAVSGLLLLATGYLFREHQLTAHTQTLAWSVTFFFASAAASSAYLTVSELFPVDLRAAALALFYTVGTSIGGLFAPAIFGALIQGGRPSDVFVGYAFGASLMIGAALFALRYGVAAERKSLEEMQL